ncbi:ubiquitin-related domain-containing protein [Trametes gibbosa]|nr:ubiquitin-related domain-containing protein [Trametes gibbosa]
MADPGPSSSSALSPNPDSQNASQLPPPAMIEQALHARIDAFAPLCPSAREVDGEERDDDDGAAGAQLAEEPIPQTPQVSLTFLLVSGRRRTMSFEPETTVGRVKELAWNTWPNDWQDVRPPAPSYLRILYLGKILQDEDSLDKMSFPTQLPSAAPSATIVHLSIRPYAPQSEDIPKKKRRLTGSQPRADAEGAEDRSSGCCSACIIC